ncbi:hypothetical protein RJI07_01280 [Mycoplasmatota bacterium WC30]
MKKILTIATLIILGFGLVSCDLFGGGENTDVTTTEEIIVDTENFIEINSVSELQSIEMNKSYILTADIDLTGIEWNPIGDQANPYLGIFDGDGYVISNLSITDNGQIYNGLFGYLSGVVKDLYMTGIDINYQTAFMTYAGGLAGFADGDIINTNISGDITVENTEANSYVGLLVGFSQGKLGPTTTVDDFKPNLIQSNIVSGNIDVISEKLAFIGGLVGKTYNTSVTNNIADTIISVITSGLPAYIGGFIGHNYGGILIGFEDQVDATIIYVEENISFSNISVVKTNSDVSIGGFIGYNNKGYNRNNYSETTIDLSGETLETNITRVGGYTGENWQSEISATVTVSDYTITLNEEVNVITGTLVAGDYSELDYSENYVLQTPNTADIIMGEVITLAQTNDSNFYLNTMEWDEAFYNLILN